MELKYTDLSFDGVIDGAIHRGVVWVLGNPHGIVAPEAVSLHVVKPGAAPMASDVSDALAPVLAWLAALRIHVVFIRAETGEYWPPQGSTQAAPMPSWLGVKTAPTSLHSPAVREQAVAQTNSFEASVGRDVPLFGRRRTYREYESSGGAKLARAAYPNQWQMIEVGLLLRGLGYDAAKVVQRGNPIFEARRGVERKVRDELSRRFGVVLDWGVPV